MIQNAEQNEIQQAAEAAATATGGTAAARGMIKNPNFVDPGMETENEYNKTHEISREEVSPDSHD